MTRGFFTIVVGAAVLVLVTGALAAEVAPNPTTRPAGGGTGGAGGAGGAGVSGGAKGAFANHIETQLAAALDQLEADGNFNVAYARVTELFDTVIARAPDRDLTLFRDAALARRLVLQLGQAAYAGMHSESGGGAGAASDSGGAAARLEDLKFLRKNKELAGTLVFLVWPGADRPSEVYSLFAKLRTARGEQLEKYANLTAAICVVHERPLTHHINENEATAADPIAIFDYYVANEKRMLWGVRNVPAELLIWVVDSSASISDMNWALARYAGDSKLGARFVEIKYDMDHFRKGTPKKLTAAGFNLPNILQYGGVCADQAYFAMTVGKAIGIPTATAVAKSASASHAWVGYFEARGSQGAWNFSVGRYESYRGLRGDVLDPQTRQYVPDSVVALTAELIATKAQDRQITVALTDAAVRLREQDLAAQGAPPGSAEVVPGRALGKGLLAPGPGGGAGRSGVSVTGGGVSVTGGTPGAPGAPGAPAPPRPIAPEARGIAASRTPSAEEAAAAQLPGALPVPRPPGTATELALLELGLRQCPGYARAWLVVRNLAVDGKLSLADKTRWAGVLDKLCGQKYPDFSMAILLPMIRTVESTAEQNKLWDGLFKMFKGRDDLAAEARMEQAQMWEDKGDTNRAGQAYEEVIRAYANAGPFIVEALRKAEGLLRDSKHPEKVVVLYEQTWGRIKQPKPMAGEFMEQTNWYRIGMMYADKLEEAGQKNKATATRTQLEKAAETK